MSSNYSCRSAHYNNLQKQEEEEKLKGSNNNNTNKNNNISSNNSSSSNTVNHIHNSGGPNSAPLRDNSNIKPRKSVEGVSQSTASPSTANTSTKASVPDRSKGLAALQIRAPKNLIPKLAPGSNLNERPLKLLESLTQKAGKETLTQPKMEKAQNQPQQVPLQISPEQLQQLQHQFQLQQAFGGTAIQVKQEFPNANLAQNQANTIEQLNKQIQEHNQAQQVQQMQLIDQSVATSQHQAQNNAMGIKYVNGKFNPKSTKIKILFVVQILIGLTSTCR